MTEVNAADEWADGRAQQRRGVVDTDHGAALAWVVDVLWRHQRRVGQTRGTHGEGGRSDGRHGSALCCASAQSVQWVCSTVGGRMCVLVVGDGSHHRSSMCRLPNVSTNLAHVETGERYWGRVAHLWAVWAGHPSLTSISIAVNLGQRRVSMHVSNSVVGSTSRDLSRLELTMAKLRKSGSRSCADLVVAYSTRLWLGLAPARLRLQVGFKPEPRKH